jgi:hypothetical protein
VGCGNLEGWSTTSMQRSIGVLEMCVVVSESCCGEGDDVEVNFSSVRQNCRSYIGT